jgi:hypothetical protein
VIGRLYWQHRPTSTNTLRDKYDPALAVDKATSKSCISWCVAEPKIIFGQRSATLLLVIVVLVHYERVFPPPKRAPAWGAASPGRANEVECPLVGDKLYALQGDAVAIDKYAGQRATVTGTVNGNNVKVEAIKSAVKKS